MKFKDIFKIGRKEKEMSWYKTYDKENIKRHIDIPDVSIFELLNKTAVKYPTYIAYNYYGKEKTYHEFVLSIRKCARAFKNLGINKGDIVTICMPNTPEALISFYALNLIGAIANMVHPLSSEGEIKTYLQMTKSETIVSADFTWDKINNIINETNLKTVILASVDISMNKITQIGYFLTKGRKIKKVKDNDKVIYWSKFYELSNNYHEKLCDNNKGNTPAVILYSGGTTGTPKGIILSNMNLNALVLEDLEVCKKLRPQVSILSVMPIFHGFGLGCCVHACFVAGGKSILLPTFSPKTFDDLVMKYKPNIIAGVPTLFETLINSKKLNNKDLSYLTCLISGGDNLSPSLKHKIDDFLKSHGSNTIIRPAYGLTEATAGVCMTPVNESRDNSIGVPVPDTYIKIVVPNTHTEVASGIEGEICVNGPTVMMGYLNNPKETSQALQYHEEDKKVWLHTGDLGYVDKDGFVYFKQRLKRMIVSSGYNIYPSYIEEVIEEHPSVLTSTVIGIDHPHKVQVAKAYIVLKEGFKPTSEIKKSIKEHCEKNIAKYAMPYVFEYRSTLPRTKLGKVNYKVLEDENNIKK